MAKTFGTGADPKGLVARGVEGSGAAQIFRPSQAVQDFVAGQRLDKQLGQKKKQAEAKAKAERDKALNKSIDDALAIDLVAWTEQDNQLIQGGYKGLLDKAAELKLQGVSPNQSSEWMLEKGKFTQLMDVIKQEKQEYSNSVKNLAQIARNENYTPEQLQQYQLNIEEFANKRTGERDFMLLTPPTPQKPIDWTKEIKGAQNLLDTFTRETPQSQTVTKVGIDEAVSVIADNPTKMNRYMTDYGFTDENEARKDIKDKVIAGSTLREKIDFAVKKGQSGRTQQEIDQNFEQWRQLATNKSDAAISYTLAPGNKFGNGTIVAVRPERSNLKTKIDEYGDVVSIRGDYSDGLKVNVKIANSRIPVYSIDEKTKQRYISDYTTEEVVKSYFVPFDDTEMLKHLYYNTLNVTDRLFLGEKGKEVKVQPKPTTVTGTPKTPSAAPTTNKFDKYKRK